MSESESSMTRREEFTVLSKPWAPSTCGISLVVTCLLTRWQSAYRRHEPNIGDDRERGNLTRDDKGNDKWLKP